MRTTMLLALTFVLFSCDGIRRSYELCPNIAFEGNTRNLDNDVGYGSDMNGDMILVSRIDLVLKNQRYAIIRQVNSNEGWCTPKYRASFDSLKQTRVSNIYWILHLDRVPQDLGVDEHDERLELFLFGPYDERTAIEEVDKLGASARNMEIVYSYEVHHLPRWMHLTDTTYYFGGREQRWWE